MSGLFGGLNLFGGAPAPAPEPFGGFAGDEDEAAAAFEEFDLGRLGSLPAADASSDDDGDRIEVDCDGRTEVISGLSLLSPQQVSQRLSDTFGSPRRTSGGGGFILRDVHGVVCPVSPELQPGRYSLESPGRSSGGFGCPAPEPDGLGHRLQWAQEPPHGAAVWLHCKTGKGGGILPSSMQHVFLPSVEVYVAVPGLSVEEQTSVLRTLRVTLYNSNMEDVTAGCLHTGRPELKVVGGGIGSVVWPSMAATATSSSQATGAAADSQSAADLDMARGAKGCYHMKVSGEGCDDLWLQDRVTGGYGRIVVKDERLSTLNKEKGKSWQCLRLGPYGAHWRCTPSHAGGDGCNCSTSFD